MELLRVFDLLEHLKTYAPKEDLFNAKISGQWVATSWQSFNDKVHLLAQGLIQLGAAPGDKVAIIAANSPEWNIIDFACQIAGLVLVPIYPTISQEDLQFILNHSEAKFIFFSDKTICSKIDLFINQLQEKIIKIAIPSSLDAHYNLESLFNKSYDADTLEVLQRRKNAVKSHDLFTILYTSGTTGVPKGVMISHSNFLENLNICQDIAPFDKSWRALSFLPLNHVYERFLIVLYLYHGVSIFYAENFETIGANCKEIQPQIFVAVPRVLERVLEKICKTGESLTGIKKYIFDQSLKHAEAFELQGNRSIITRLKHKMFDRLVYSKWREAIGGKIELVVSGGAALNPRIERIFTCAGIILLQGYGLTETAVVVAVNRWEQSKRCFGTVGPTVENSIVKINPEDGEILIKGPSVMMGYYKNEQATREVIDHEGFFHTGDVGSFVGNFLKITDRKKEIFKNSSGKYIAPVALENKLKESKYIEQCMIIGEGEKFVSALIVCSEANFKEYFERQQIPWTGYTSLANHESVHQLIMQHIANVNKHLAPFEQIKRPQILSTQWSVESGEITPKLSLKRKVILEKNKELIQKIFLKN